MLPPSLHYASFDNMVLLTGGTGFVGRHVLALLLAKGLKVRVVVRDMSALSVETRSLLTDIVYTYDIFDQDVQFWEDACSGVDTVLHLAWYAEPGYYLQSPKNLECMRGTLRLAQGASRAKVRRVVGIGTCIEYDLSYGMLTADTPLRPLTPYAEAKVFTFLALSHWLERHGVEFAWCRLFYLYGDGERQQRLLPYLRSRLQAGLLAELSSGKQIRDFLDVQDAAKLIVEITLGRHQGPLNISSGVPITVREFAEKVADEYGRRDLLRFGVKPDPLNDAPCIVGLRPTNT